MSAHADGEAGRVEHVNTMIIFRFFLYGSVLFALLGACIQLSLEPLIYLTVAGGGLSALSCIAILIMIRIWQELAPQ